jgi:hypothetical protein
MIDTDWRHYNKIVRKWTIRWQIEFLSYWYGAIEENAENRWELESNLNSTPLQRYG